MRLPRVGHASAAPPPRKSVAYVMMSGARERPMMRESEVCTKDATKLLATRPGSLRQRCSKVAQICPTRLLRNPRLRPNSAKSLIDDDRFLANLIKFDQPWPMLAKCDASVANIVSCWAAIGFCRFARVSPTRKRANGTRRKWGRVGRPRRHSLIRRQTNRHSPTNLRTRKTGRLREETRKSVTLKAAPGPVIDPPCLRWVPAIF